MTDWLRTHSIGQIGRRLQSRRVRPITVVLALFFLMPLAALAQSSPFDTGFTAIQSLFTGTIAKVASLVAIVIGGYGFAHGEPGAKKASSSEAWTSRRSPREKSSIIEFTDTNKQLRNAASRRHTAPCTTKS